MENLPYLPSAIRRMNIREDYNVKLTATATPAPITALKKPRTAPTTMMNQMQSPNTAAKTATVVLGLSSEGHPPKFYSLCIGAPL